jgi:2-isopropylmalate synthase
MAEIKIYDTTLRDGSQMEGINFSVQDKIQIALKLDELGIHYIEGGWPGSNPKDIAFFEKAQKISFRNAKICSFGSTRKAETKPDQDKNLRLLLEAGSPVITIFGKSWTLHVKRALRTTLDENLKMIDDSINFLKSAGKTVFFDAEHFFDGYKQDRDYALKTIEVAYNAGADAIILCDTNGGALPYEIETIFSQVMSQLPKSFEIGMHAHNDGGVAVANSLVAISCGANQIQGTFNGYGERCGNANLCSIIPNMVLKMGISCLSEEKLKNLVDVSRFIDETANMRPNRYQPFVGKSAFTHKGGIHASAIMRDPLTYEHIIPDLVGNQRRILVSEQAGKSNILYRAHQAGVDLQPDDSRVTSLIEKIKESESYGYQYEGADASFEMMLREALGETMNFFTLQGFRVIVEKRGDEGVITEATIKLNVENQMVHTAAEGDGPVHALDNALRKALENLYPQLKRIRLSDYKVRVLNEKDGTTAKIRVLIQTTDGSHTWGTVGVSTDIIEASWEALEDSVKYGLWQKTREEK